MRSRWRARASCWTSWLAPGNRRRSKSAAPSLWALLGRLGREAGRALCGATRIGAARPTIGILLKRCRHMARLIALIYNWWSLFVRLADPDRHREAITGFFCTALPDPGAKCGAVERRGSLAPDPGASAEEVPPWPPTGPSTLAPTASGRTGGLKSTPRKGRPAPLRGPSARSPATAGFRLNGHSRTDQPRSGVSRGNSLSQPKRTERGHTRYPREPLSQYSQGLAEAPSSVRACIGRIDSAAHRWPVLR